MFINRKHGCKSNFISYNNRTYFSFFGDDSILKGKKNPLIPKYSILFFSMFKKKLATVCIKSTKYMSISS